MLDEITEMPIELQVKLLRVLETSKVTRIGGSQSLNVDVRVIAATNVKPEEAVAKGKLREDLLYRLNVFPIQLPHLRDRKEDVELLAQHFLSQLNKEHGTRKDFARSALQRLRGYSWPGSVRELKNVVHRAFILAEDEITLENLPLGGEEAAGSALQVKVGTSIAEVERRLIMATLEQCDGDKKKAAHVLGVSVKTLYNRLNEFKAD
jgi:DNA-binding NtrC family response regulator